MDIFKRLWDVAAIFATVLFAATATAGPVITRQPSPAMNSVSVGASLTNQIAASTTQPPLTYRWLFNGVALPGADKAMLVLTNIQVNAAGEYRAVVLDSSGSVESLPWLLGVDPTFTKLQSDPSTAAGPSGAVSWVDQNGDGYLDLFLSAGPTSLRHLYTNNHAGGFNRVTAGNLVTDTEGGASVWGDYDNDGREDLFEVSLAPGVRNFVYHNAGLGKFDRIATNQIASVAGFFTSPSWVDYDCDGLLDAFFTDWEKPNRLYHNLGGGVFQAVTNGIVVSDAARNSNGCSWSDYNNDGFPDLLVCNRNGSACLYHNDGGGRFTKITNNIGTLTAGSSSVAWADYDNDGDMDLFVTGNGNGRRRILFRNVGNGAFAVANGLGSLTSDIGEDSAVAWGDYDNDGDLDLFIASGAIFNAANGFRDFLYRNNGDGTFTRIFTGSLVNDNGEASGAAWADFNQDGFLDLYVANAQKLAPDKNALYRNNGNSNAWMTIRCEGRVSNASAIGAKVRLLASIDGRTVWQLREISGSTCNGSQPSREVHFGLGDATNASIIRVEWPSGIVQELVSVPARQHLILREPSRISARPLGAGEWELEIFGAVANTTLERSADLSNWSPETEVITNAVTQRSTKLRLNANRPASFLRLRE
jgi:enediyne biosynthesis protein E4